MIPRVYFSRRMALSSSVFLLPLMLAAGQANAQSTDIGSVDVKSGAGGLPVSSPAAVGSKAPPGSAPALSPSQGSLDSFQPGSIISDKVIRDIAPPSSDYNETAKYTPGWVSNNSNGLLGDTKGGWRGYQDGQYNITFDGIPFGDANDPTHHSAAYFPGAFLGGVTINRGPGAASQIGYATFGGTMALRSFDLSDTFGGNVDTSFGSFGTMTNSLTAQSGLIGQSGVRSLFQYSHANTDGAVTLDKVNQDQFLGKADAPLGNDFRITVFGTYGQEQYNNAVAITYPQLQKYGKNYGAINNNPLTQQFRDYNDSQKATDMEYIALEGDLHDWHIDNRVYTYSYWYPQLQNNGNDQTIEGPITAANGAVTTVKIPQPGGAPSVTRRIIGVASTDVVGYIKDNNYRAYGDIFKVSHDIDAGVASGTLRAGMWIEHIDNDRLQEYYNYTTNKSFPALGNGIQSSYKLDLSSHITNYQPFIEYDWRPIEGLTITPGYKFEAFVRDHQGLVNQTTLAPVNYTGTYTTSLPFLAVNYKVTPEVSVYAQASQGFLAPTVSAFYVFSPSQTSIEPQSTTNYQAGAVYKSGCLTMDADVYQIRATNFPVTNTLSTGETTYTNGGTAVYRGLEAEGTYSIINGLSAYASGAAISAKYTSGAFENQRVGDAPDYTLVGGAIYDDGMFFGSLLQKFTGAAYGSSGQKVASAATNASLNYVKSYNTTDLIIGVRSSALHDFGIGNNVKIRFGIYNIFDHRNTTEIAGDPTGLTSINNTKLTYSFLPGRTIFGSVGIAF